ncbi:MAG TPA: hypothetical protein VIO60_05615 [Rectinemataceae bacterium]
MSKTIFKPSIAILILVAMALFASFPLAAQSMWTVQEIAEIDSYSEMEDLLLLKFKDAVSGEVIRGVVVSVGGKQYTGRTDGIVELPIELVENVDDKDIPFTASAQGYIDLNDTLKVRLGSVTSKRFLMTKGFKFNQARIVVEWDRKPADIDAHLVGPGFHVSYRNMRASAGNARLDRDARQGFGPETITLEDIRNDATYTYSLENYSRESPMLNVKVTVYFDNRVHKVLFYPEIRQASLVVLSIERGQIFYNER